MKKVILNAVFLLITTVTVSQLPVSQLPMKRKAVIEEFTGINCGACPNAHLSADQVKASKPAGDVIVVSIHQGPYSTPYPNQPDYRTPEGNIIATQTPSLTISGYPDATVNRRTQTWGVPIKNASYNIYGYFSDQVLSEASPVNVALQGTVDINTRVLTIQSEVYYTGNSIAPTNSLVISLIENWVVGPQSNGAAIYPAMANSNGTYNHQHMLRKVISANAYGDPISPTTAGTKHSLTYTYTIPANYGSGTNANACNLNNIELVAYVIDADWEIRTAAYGPVSQAATTTAIKEEDQGLNNVNVYPNPAANNLNVSIASEKDENATLNVLNNLGQVVLTQNLPLEAGNNLVEVNIHDLSEGSYSLNVISSRGAINKKIVILK